MTTSVEPAEGEVGAEHRPGCAVCGHALETHDAISRRYCQATQTNALARRCICPTEASPEAFGTP